MNSFILKRNLYKVSKDLFDITKGLEHLGYINDDARDEAALKTYLYNTNAVNLNHTQYLIMLGIAKNCWYFKRPVLILVVVEDGLVPTL